MKVENEEMSMREYYWVWYVLAGKSEKQKEGVQLRAKACRESTFLHEHLHGHKTEVVKRIEAV
jgi:hypothetical protein